MNNKAFFDQPIKDKQESHEKFIYYLFIKYQETMTIQQEIY